MRFAPKAQLPFHTAGLVVGALLSAKERTYRMRLQRIMSARVQAADIAQHKTNAGGGVSFV